MVLLNNDEAQLVLALTNKVEIQGNQVILQVAGLITKLATSIQQAAATAVPSVDTQMAEAVDIADEDDEEVDTVVMSIADTKRAIDQ